MSIKKKLDHIISQLEKESRDMTEAIDLLSRAMQYVVNSKLSHSIEMSMEIQTFLKRRRPHDS